MQVSIDSAKSDLVELIAAALRGEDAVIAEGTTPVVRLVPVGKKKFKLGIWEHKLMGPVPDFLEPMSEEELALWEGGN